MQVGLRGNTRFFASLAMTSDAVSSVLGNAFDQGFSPARQQQHICALRLWQFHFSSFLLCACARLVDALALLLLEASHLFCHVAASHLYCHYAASHVCCHHTASHCCLARTAALPMTQLTGRLKPIVKTLYSFGCMPGLPCTFKNTQLAKCAQPLLDCILCLTRYLYDPGILPYQALQIRVSLGKCFSDPIYQGIRNWPTVSIVCH